MINLKQNKGFKKMIYVIAIPSKNSTEKLEEVKAELNSSLNESVVLKPIRNYTDEVELVFKSDNMNSLMNRMSKFMIW